MLGDSMRRRHKVDRKRGRKLGQKRADSGPRLRWGRWILVTAGLVVFAFGTGYGVAARVLFPIPAAASENAIEVPALSGVTVPEAERRLQEQGLALGEVTQIAHPREAAGIVIAQTPLPGQQLRPGATVGLAVSSGPSAAVVPDVGGLPHETASELLRRLGFTVNRRDEVVPGPAGLVVRIHPEPGSRHALPASVTLFVSVEPEPEPEPEPEDKPDFPILRGFDFSGQDPS